MQEAEITVLLRKWSEGDEQAFDRLMPLIVDDLRRQAESYLRRERAGHTLQPTALVHEVYLRLLDQKRASWKDRGHFLSVAAKIMRWILVDHARAHKAGKRGGWIEKVQLDEARDMIEGKELDLVALDDALEALAALDSRQSQVIELRFFAGLSVDETAEVLGVGPATVGRDWRNARAYLQKVLGLG